TSSSLRPSATAGARSTTPRPTCSHPATFVRKVPVEPTCPSGYRTEMWERSGGIPGERGGGMGLFTGKRGLILGVANDFSIAWAITKKLQEEGAELGFTHLPGDKMERRVRKLAEPIGARLITPCDVQNDEDLARVFAQARQTYGTLDFVLHSIAFAPVDDLKCPFVNASREGFKTAMDISVYSLAIVARQAAAAMP